MKLLDSIIGFSAPNVFNPWRDCDPLDTYGREGPAHRVARLAQHFNCLPKFLLIGEAPGYQGCHFSGVPFTNEALLLDGAVPRVPCHVRITTRPLPWREPSATIVWKELHKLGIAAETVMWNAFAWHPHKPGEPMSNRAPTKQEVKAGADVLRSVLDHFNDCRYIAVGQVAKRALEQAGIGVFATVRHPSMGGANQFRAQMAALGAGQRT
jgi:uracil-DNA glycosylase